MAHPKRIVALVLARARSSAQKVHYYDIVDGNPVTRTYEATQVRWPELPPGSTASTLAINPHNPHEALWFVTIPSSSPDFLASINFTDINKLLSLYSSWTGGKAPPDLSNYPAFELSA